MRGYMTPTEEQQFVIEIAEKAYTDFLLTNPTDQDIHNKFTRLRQELDASADNSNNILERAARILCTKLGERTQQK
jgi:hypothetical protein